MHCDGRTVTQMATVGGFVAPGFERVAEVMANGATVSWAMANAGGTGSGLRRRGRCLLRLRRRRVCRRPGPGSAGDDRPWDETTRGVIMSSTKGMTAVCAHVLEDRGELDLDAPVVRYWPEFGQAGKERPPCASSSAISRARSGCPAPIALLGWDGTGWDDTRPSRPGWPRASRPGNRGPATAITASPSAGWSASWCGGSAGAAWAGSSKTEVAGPLGATCSIGTPAAEVGSVATVLEFPVKPGQEGALTAIDPTSKSGRSVLAGAHGSLFADEDGRPVSPTS